MCVVCPLLSFLVKCPKVTDGLVGAVGDRDGLGESLPLVHQQKKNGRCLVHKDFNVQNRHIYLIMLCSRLKVCLNTLPPDILHTCLYRVYTPIGHRAGRKKEKTKKGGGQVKIKHISTLV